MKYYYSFETEQPINNDYVKMVLLSCGYIIKKSSESDLKIFKKVNRNYSVEKTRFFKETALVAGIKNIISGQSVSGALTADIQIENNKKVNITPFPTFRFYINSFLLGLLGIIFIIFPASYILTWMISSIVRIGFIFLFIFITLFIAGSVLLMFALLRKMKKNLFNFIYADLETIFNRKKLNHCINCGRVNLADYQLSCPDCGELL